MLRLKNVYRGDTIVEVLIAMAVIALVLGGSYATASRSLQVGRRAQERVEAVKLVEAQIEQLKYLAIDPTKDMFNANAGQNIFCIDNSAKVAITDFNNHAAYPGACVKQGLFSVGMRYEGANPGQDNTFTVQAKWDRLGGGGTEEVVVKYRLHP